jgi:hypothetical protein
MNRSSQTVRIVALLAISGLAFPVFAQSAQEGKKPESAPSTQTPPTASPQPGRVVPGSLTAASRAASQALQEMMNERINPPPVDMPDAPITNEPKKP